MLRCSIKKSSACFIEARRAVAQDFKSVYEIWMQDHVLPFMVWETLSPKEFQVIFRQLMASSDVYVLVNHLKKIMAVKRVIYGKKQRAHTAHFASFAVHKNYQRQGLGQFFYTYLLKQIAEKKPAITRVDFIQETDNPAAFSLANKMGFHVEAVFPDGFERLTGRGDYVNKWLVGQRFHARLLDPPLEKLSISISPFLPQLPLLTLTNHHSYEALHAKVKMITTQKQSKAYDSKGQRIATVSILDYNDGRRYTQPWVLKLAPGYPESEAWLYVYLRQLAVRAAQTHKKIECWSFNETVLKVLKGLGFHCRGQKKAGVQLHHVYYDEQGVDLGFFNITDARSMLEKTLKNKQDIYPVLHQLAKCQDAVTSLFIKNRVDAYGKLYLENLAFQMTREALGETRCYTAQNAPFSALIEQLLGALKKSFKALEVCLKNKERR